jgi:hypothetical protein
LDVGRRMLSSRVHGWGDSGRGESRQRQVRGICIEVARFIYVPDLGEGQDLHSRGNTGGSNGSYSNQQTVMVLDGESYRERIVARAWGDATKIAIFDGFGCSLVNSLFPALYFYFQHVVLDFNTHAAFRCHALFQCHAPFRYA